MNYFPTLVALPKPLFEAFSYQADRFLPIGIRVRVPFGRGEVLGVVVGHAAAPEGVKVKQVTAVLDEASLFSDDLFEFLRYAARYYQHPFGEVLTAALPNALVHGQENIRQLSRFYQITAEGERIKTGRLGEKQRAVLLAAQDWMAEEVLKEEFQVSPSWLADLCARGWLEVSERFVYAAGRKEDAPVLSDEQSAVLSTLAQREGFVVDVLEGVTGSGKTEVYLQRIEQLIANDGQVLLLAPEIGIVELLYQRLLARLTVAVGVHHSGMSDAARLASWQAVKAGDVRVLVGTRSAIFSDFANLRGIIVDECHEQAYKQQDGFRYHGRDMAVARAKLLGIPILLGSATPSLETWRQISLGHWGHLKLTKRIQAAAPPQITIDDISRCEQVGGLSVRLIGEIHRQLQANQQVMLFLNRRGYAPVLLCEDCGWKSECPACDAMMTAHMTERRMQCHHCGRVQSLPTRCPACSGASLALVGMGTQRLEQSVRQQFPMARILRIDSDAFTTAKQFQSAVAQIHQGEVDIILGTQWLAKGHHFPNLQLVAVVDADSALYSSDFRAEERLAQQLVQVGGRAGRESSGHIWVQTRLPSHPIFNVFHQPYSATLKWLAKSRKENDLPPYSAQALLFARHKQAEKALQALALTKQGALSVGIGENWQWFGPAPAVMARKDGQHRANLLLQAESKIELQKQLPALMPWLLAQGKALNVRVGIDVDPLWTD